MRVIVITISLRLYSGLLGLALWQLWDFGFYCLDRVHTSVRGLARIRGLVDGRLGIQRLIRRESGKRYNKSKAGRTRVPIIKNRKYMAYYNLTYTCIKLHRISIMLCNW